jgi:hypothetical protein
MKSSFLFVAVAVCSFELYFYLDYKIYINAKTSYYPARRRKFIQGIEEDFRKYVRIPLNSGGHSVSFQAAIPLQFRQPS